jgi:hypothetical protein
MSKENGKINDLPKAMNAESSAPFWQLRWMSGCDDFEKSGEQCGRPCFIDGRGGVTARVF